jgi:hypothetical protein
MRKTLASVSAVVVCLGATAPVAEAQLGTKRPPILQVFREEVKPGRQPAHTKNEASWIAAVRKAGSKGYYYAMTNGSEAWFVTPQESFAAAEAQAKEDEANAALSAEVDRIWAADGEMLSKASGMTLVYREDLSFRTDWDTAKMRYFAVSLIRVSPGYEGDFEQVRKLISAAHEKAKVDERWSCYQVITGAPRGTFVFFAPMASLAQWDKYEAMHGKEYQEALGESSRSRIRDFERVGEKGSETNLFSLSPKMSYLPKEVTDRDPDFWTPKPAPAAGKKEEKKP